MFINSIISFQIQVQETFKLINKIYLTNLLEPKRIRKFIQSKKSPYLKIKKLALKIIFKKC